MCQVKPVAYSCCSRIYVEVAKLSSCPPDWPATKCPQELCILIGNGTITKVSPGMCWRCQATHSGKTGAAREVMRPRIDSARIAPGLDDISLPERKAQKENSGECWHCGATKGCTTCESNKVKSEVQANLHPHGTGPSTSAVPASAPNAQQIPLAPNTFGNWAPLELDPMDFSLQNNRLPLANDVFMGYNAQPSNEDLDRFFTTPDYVNSAHGPSQIPQRPALPLNQAFPGNLYANLPQGAAPPLNQNFQGNFTNLSPGPAPLSNQNFPGNSYVNLPQGSAPLSNQNFPGNPFVNLPQAPLPQSSVQQPFATSLNGNGKAT